MVESFESVQMESMIFQLSCVTISLMNIFDLVKRQWRILKHQFWPVEIEVFPYVTITRP